MTGEPRPTRSFAALFVVAFLVILGLIGLTYFIHIRFLADPWPLPDVTFASRLEQRTYWDEKLKQQITYWVIATTNQSRTAYYGCTFDIVAKGTQDQYRGFFRDYTLRNCYQYSQVKANYDCRLENGWVRFTRYSSSVTRRKFDPGSTSELAVSRFYLGETRSNLSFLAKNQLSDIYSLVTTCRTSAGRPVAHTQLF